MTKQEMFEASMRGLASQGWERATTEGGNVCVYQTADGKRCAWGWVDMSLTAENTGNVHGCGGLADSLDEWTRAWARRLQVAHDTDYLCDPRPLRDRFIAFAGSNNLTWPEGL